MTTQRFVPISFMAALFALALAGCDREGPGERAGESVDRAVERSGDAIEDAGDKARD